MTRAARASDASPIEPSAGPETDVLVVGAGPIGLECARRLRQGGVSALVLDAGEIGATFGWWAPNTRFFSSPERLAICGVPLLTSDQGKCTGEAYADYLRGVVQQFSLPVRTFERVVRIRRADDGRFEALTTASTHGVGGPAEASRAEDARPPAARLYRAQHVVLAIGNMHRPRLLGIEGEGLPHVSHFFRGPHRHFGRRVLIVGGKNSAVEAALRCWRAGANVTLSYRGDRLDEQRVKYWLRPEIEWLIGRGEIAWLPRTTPTRITPDRVTLRATDGRESQTDADDVLLMTGYVQDSTLFEQLGLELVGPTRRPRLDEHHQASTPGVFVAGTACAGSMTRATVFIETAHVHAERIAERILHGGPEEAQATESPRETTEADYGPMEES